MNRPRLYEDAKRVLRNSYMRRVREGLGGSHTVVTYPPLDALDALSEGDDEPFALSPSAEPIHCYLHVAYCERICGFCHYTTAKLSDDASSYVTAMRHEVDRRRTQLAGAKVTGVYVGGGTPTALPTAELARVMDAAGTLAGKGEGEICVETSPITIAAPVGIEKLALLRAAGVTRISMGVQTSDGKLLPGLRGHDQALLLRAIDRLKDARIPINIDLIQDIPGQTTQSIENDLALVDRYRPEQVTWYVLRVHAPSSFAKRARANALFPVSDIESAMRRATIIEEMEQLGYRRGPGGRFTLDGKRDIYKSVRGGVDAHLLGFGASAYSHGWGWFFRNVAQKSARGAIRDYVARIEAGKPATGWATRITESERYAGQLCQLSREHIPASMLERDGAAAAAARETIESLVSTGLMTGDGTSGWKPTRVGQLFEEEISSLFYSARTRSRLEAARAYWIPHAAQDAVALSRPSQETRRMPG